MKTRLCKHASLRQGFSLVELIVVIGIIAFLVALALPAVNSVIESSRRNGCQANQSKLALAMARHNSRKEYLPGLRNDITTAVKYPQPKQGHVNWFIASLPYLGRQDVYDGVVDGDVYSIKNVNYRTGGLDELNALTRCPSTSSQSGFRQFAMQYLANAGAPTFGLVTLSVPNPDYASSATVLTSFNRNDGAIGDNASYNPLTLNNSPNAPIPNPMNNPMSLDDIRKGDGQAFTLLLSETINRRNNDTMLWDLMWPPYSVDVRLTDNTTVTSSYPGAVNLNGSWGRRIPVNIASSGEALVFGFANITPTATTQIINSGAVGLDFPSAPNVHTLPKSRHESGCFAAFVDGSTRFLKQDLAPHVYGHLLTSRSTYDPSGPTGQRYVTNSILANRYLAAPSYTGPQPFVLQSTDY